MKQNNTEKQSNQIPMLYMFFIMILTVRFFESFQEGILEKLWFVVLMLLLIYLAIISRKTKLIITLNIISIVCLFIMGVVLFG